MHPASKLAGLVYFGPYRFFAFNVAPLRETFFSFLSIRHVIQWAKVFCLTQRRNDAT